MIKTYRAGSMHQALALVRQDLGPDAAVLHTRELNRGWLGRFFGRQQYEVAASAAVQAARGGPAEGTASVPTEVEPTRPATVPEAHLDVDYRQKFRADFRNQVQGQLDQLTSLVEELYQRTGTPGGELPAAMFDVFTDLIEAEVDEQIARELIDRVTRRREGNLDEAPLVKSRITSLVEAEIHVTGPIATPRNTRRIVALVGPTGVGKTTTIAKLAANFRLREKRKVGLITVDTYRIAAVEQLRTYADIIDLPMEVVSTPREMREAVARLANLDLVLVDTAGRSPRDEVRIQELKSMLAEATADEVHLVLSSTSGARQLITTADRFAEVGATALLLTKLDEATGLGHLISLCRECRLPISYLTDGQNVPDDILVAERRSVARLALGMPAATD